MTAIAKIKISHEAFLEMLSQSIETQYNASLYKNEDTWQNLLTKSDVIHQWDPERDIMGKPLNRQAIQLGIRGEVIKKYINEYIITVENVTDLALEISEVLKRKSKNFPEVPEEKPYPLAEEGQFRAFIS